MKKLEEKIGELPIDLRQEVEDFVEFLIEKRKRKKKKGHFTFGWAGALRELRDKYTSVELQHKITQEWWGD
ncbi:MAG: DUF2281 domain-containing protein [bacterium]